MKKIAVLLVAFALAGCGSLNLQDPFVNGKFDSAVWKADVAAVKAAAKGTLDDVRAVMAEVCPVAPKVLAEVNDPSNQAMAVSVAGVNAVQKNTNNVNDAVQALADACAVGDAASARGVLVAAVQAINDAKAIYASIKK